MTPRDMKVIEVPKWCYKGRHSVEHLCPKDECTVYPEVVVINETACEINQKIFSLDSNQDINVLKVENDRACEGSDVILDISLNPNA